ncbi:MAG: hypothetical protein ABW055_04500, partial [Pararhizobium sp.]
MVRAQPREKQAGRRDSAPLAGANRSRSTRDRQARPPPAGTNWQMAGMAAAWFCVIVGLTIGSLWVLKSGHVADTLPVLFRMQFNTAVSFVLTGLAVAALLKGAGRIATGLAIVVMLI